MFLILLFLPKSGITCWYDFELYSNFAKMFYAFGSLHAVCQEGMEAVQKQSNMFLRLGSNFARVGRIPLATIRAGRDAVAALMAMRKSAMKTPQMFLFMKKLMAFYAEWYSNFTAAEAYKASGNVIDWLSEFVPAWRSFVSMSTIYRICAAHRRWKKSATLARPQVVKWRRSEDGRTFAVKVYDSHRLKLVREVAAYYEKVSCENKRDWKSQSELDESGIKDQRKQIQKGRRQRWQKRVCDAELWREMPEPKDV